jgi:tetratricopeptide (TPR) repeat protein
MVLLTNVRCVILVATLAWGAAAQRLEEGQQLSAKGRYAEAHAVFTSMLRDAEKNDADAGTVALILDNLAVDETDLGNFREAENVFNRALSILPPDTPAASKVKAHLAELYMNEHRPAEAEPLLRQAAATLRDAGQPERVALGVTYNDLAIALAMQRKKPESETLLRRALAMLEEELGPDHPILTSSLEPLAALLLVEQRYADAVAPAERAWRILQSYAPHVGTPDLAGVLDILGQVYAHSGRMVEAESCARQASTMAEQVYGPKHPRLGLFLQRYADVLNRANRKKEAKEVQKRARAILAQADRGAVGSTVSVSALR